MNSLRQTIPRPIRRAASAWLAHRRSAQLQRDLARMAVGGAAVVAGPWLGEVGFELLYWVPFLRWSAHRLGISPDRFVVISRGGTASWYTPFAGRYVDVFDQVSAETFRDQHDVRVREFGEQKQTRVTAFDRGLVQAAVRHTRIDAWSLLHPSRMYALLNPYWWGHQSSEWVHTHATYARLAPPPSSGIADLPASYVAVKFYFNDCFPPTAQNRAFVGEVLRTLAARGPVIALSTGLNIDDHGGVRVDEYGVRHLPEGLNPVHNLQVQSALVAGAQAFVGTYGGFSYMAPFYGVKSIGFYSDGRGYSPKHLHIARSAFERIGSAGLLDVRATEMGPGVI